MGVGNPGRRIGVVVIALLAAAALCAALATSAGATKLVKNGRVYACYKAKAPRKGAVRLVAKKGKCRKGERKISWNLGGRLGEAGQGGENGENAAPGEPGAVGEPGAATIRGLEGKISALTGKVTSLESVLKGITNTELLGALTKLQGISGTQLQETVASLADVKALCTQATKLTDQVNTIGGLFGGIKLGGTIPPLLGIVVPSAPTSLAAFGC